MTTGVTNTGFVRPSLQEIREAIIADLEAAIGPINTGPESAVGEMIGIFAAQISTAWEAIEATYQSRYPAAAFDAALDGAVSLTGITRNAATRSIVVVTLTGTAGTLIPAGSRITTTAGDDFEIPTDYTLLAGDNDVQFRAVEAGAIPIPANGIAFIKNPIAGWSTAQNDEPGTVGRDRETDAELRNRRELSIQIGGAGTVPSLLARTLEQVPDVLSAVVIENRTGEEDADGRPPHSFELVVAGGLDQDIGDKIWETKPAGIETFGNVEVTVVDSQGNDQIVYFSRPILKYVWANVELEQEFAGSVPSDFADRVKTALVAFGQRLGLGKGILIQSLYGPIYSAMTGIDTVNIEVAVNDSQVTPPDPGEFTTENLDIARNAITVWEPARIVVTAVAP